jgi:nucleotide-binding universal stress UspA family protein
MKRVIAAVDNSATARSVVAVALAIAPPLGATAEAVHVTENGEHTARAAARQGGLTLQVVDGDPVDRLLRFAAGMDVVALVAGTRGCPSASQPIGHVALAVANRADTPVVLVSPECEPATALRRVVVALEGTPANARRLKRAVALAADAHLEIVAVHVDDERTLPSFSDQVQHETEAYTKEFLARFVPGATDVRLELRVGDPAREILDVAESSGAQLLAIGWPQTDDPARGVVAHEIVRRSRLPVFLAALEAPPSGG